MFYLLTLQFQKPDKVIKNELYYAILGGLLKLFDNQKTVYDSILKLSFFLNQNLNIQLTIQGSENYNYIVNYLLQNQDKEISINGFKFQLKQLNFQFEIFDPKELEFKEFDNFELRFYSPTFIRHINITYSLPNPEQFLFSIFAKLDKIFEFKIDNKLFKEWLKYNIYIGEFDIHTSKIRIKNGRKSGVIGNCKYYLKDKENTEFVRLLFLILKAIRFVGVGNGVKLGCGNVGSFLQFY